jgi:hypothetical protein
MADEKEPAAGEDPWAGLESEQMPDLNEGFDFSFDETAEDADHEDSLAESTPVDLSASPGDGGIVSASTDQESDEDDVNEWLEEPEGGGVAPGLSVFQSGDDDAAEGDSDLWQAEAEEPSSIDTASEHSSVRAVASEEAVPSAEASDVADDLGGEDPFAAAMASKLFDGDSPEDSAAAVAAASEMFEPGDEPAEDTDEAAGNTGGMFSFAETAEGDAQEPASENASSEPAESNDFDFMGLSAGSDEPEGEVHGEVGETAEGEPSSSEEFDGFEATAIAAASTAEPKAEGKKAAKPTRAAPPKKKKPSMVGQMIGMVVGGAMSIPIVLAILWWGVGKDPLKVAPMVPDSLSFLLPAKLRSGGQVAATSGEGSAPSLDDVLGGTGVPEPDTTDTAAVETDTADAAAPVLPEPDPVEPAVTDVAVTEPAPDAGSQGDDELMAILNEETPPPSEPAPPPSAPEPEPLDIAALQEAADKALATVAALEGSGDPTDPVHKKSLVECYKALAAYAQELAMIERVAADTGRPLAAMPAPATAMHEALAARPELFDALARLTRDWLAYSKRTSDGVVAPVTFVSARRVGPYWRAEVTVGEKPLVVLMRSEPGAAQGDVLLVTGLSVDKDVVWATDIQPAKAGDPFGL